jgi:hypothetical protein
VLNLIAILFPTIVVAKMCSEIITSTPQNKYLKWFEAGSCGIAASSMAFMMMILANDCKPVDIDDNEYGFKKYFLKYTQ